jgi:hypothetical protein
MIETLVVLLLTMVFLYAIITFVLTCYFTDIKDLHKPCLQKNSLMFLFFMGSSIVFPLLTFGRESAIIISSL